MTKANKANANCNQLILDHFWNICQSSEEKRCKSIEIILNTLSHQVKTNIDKNDISYCLLRLIRGLVSAREFARHGFCVLLTKLISQFEEQIELEDVINKAEKEYGKNINNPNPENAIAWTLLIGCILKSGRFSSNQIDSNEALILRLFDILFKFGSKKNYIEIIVCNLLSIFYGIFASNQKAFSKIVLDKIKENETECNNSIFFIYAVLLANQKFPLVSKAYATNYISNNVYKSNSKDYKKIISLFKEATKYSPNVHPFIELAIETIMKMHSNQSTFYSKTIEEIFKVNLEKTSLGFEIVKICLKNADDEQIELILSPSFMRVFIQTLSNKKHPLHNSATELGNYFVKFSSDNYDNANIQVAFAKCFINKPGSINFDELSKSKILTGILKSFSNDSIKNWTLFLVELMTSQENIPNSDFIRIRCLQQISNLLKSYVQNDEFLWTMNKFMFTYSYFDVSGSKKNILQFENKSFGQFTSPLSEKLQKQFPDCFKALFAHQYHLSTLNINSPQEKLQNQIQVLSILVEFIEKILNKKYAKLIVLENCTAEKLKQLWSTLAEKVEKINNLESISVQSNIFKMLYLYFMIQIFENITDISNILPDFDECVKRALFKTKKSDGPVWADVLIELLLSLLTTKSKYIKNIVTIAFKHICPYLSTIGIQSLTDAITNNDAFCVDDSDDEADEEMEVDEENENKDDDEDDDIIDADDDGEVDEQFKNDVIKALGNAADDSDNEIDLDNLSDSEMFKLDDTLAEIFRNKFGQKKAQNEKQNLIQTFKQRVLELIHILVEQKELSLRATFDIASTVIGVVRSNYALKNMSALTSRCIQIIGQISKKRSFTNDNEDTPTDTEFEDIFNLLIEFQCKCSNLELQKNLISITSWILIVSKENLPDIDFVNKSIDDSLNNLFTRSNIELKPALFAKLVPQLIDINQTPFLKTPYYRTLVDYSFKSDIRAFKRSLALDLLFNILKSSSNRGSSKQIAELGVKTFHQLLTEFENIASGQKNKSTNNKETKFQYANLLIKLFLLIDELGGKSDKVEMFNKNEFKQKFDALPKDFRKRMDKRFIKKFNNMNEN